MTLTLLRNGRIHTAADPDATALAISGGTIIWVGGEHAAAQAGTPDRVVDLDGAFVAAGFVDAHVHCTDAGLAISQLDLSGTRTKNECLVAITAHARTCGDAILWGHGWDETCWAAPEMPTRAEIDEAVGSRPAYFSRIDVHSALVSSALTALVPDVAGLDGCSGQPGPAETPPSRAAHAALRQAARGLITGTQRRRAQIAFLELAASRGIVAVHECGAADPVGLEDFADLLAQDGPVAVVGYLAALVSDPGEATGVLARTGAHGLAGDLSVDGAVGSRTAALTDPYTDSPRTCGARYLTDEQIRAHLVACALAGIQPGFHAIGDGAVTAVATALAEAARDLDSGAQRGTVRLAGCAPRIEHAEMASPDAVSMLAASGAVASMQPLFDDTWGGPDRMYARRLGAGRSAGMNNLAGLAAAGVALAFGSDAPVTAADPWRAVRAAVHHRTAGCGLSPRAAFTAHTRGGHRAARTTDHGVGTIAVGAPAHLAVHRAGDLVRPTADTAVQRSSLDPRSRRPLLPDLTPGAPLPTVLATIVAGRVVYDAGVFGGTDPS